MSRIDTATIPGWGVDADPDNDPAWPMRHTEGPAEGLNWTRPAQQRPGVEVLRSIEHNRLPAVTGTSTPPSGLSGAIRRVAFRRSESDWLHWLMLMGADRINVVEGVVADLARGKVPNVPAEMGMAAEWKHNKRGFVTKAGTTLALGALTVAFARAWRQAGADEEAEPMPAQASAVPAFPADVTVAPATAPLQELA